MRLLLLQLSDIHLREDDNPILTKSAKLVDAVRNLDYELDGCIIVLSGDIAFSGSGDEYLSALSLVEEISSRLSKELPRTPPVRCVAVPGNHDCALIPEMMARTAILDHVGTIPGQVVDNSIVELCTSVQSEFFGFREAVASLGLIGTDRLFYEYAFRFGAETIRFECFNTAWVSRLPEAEGSLYFPVERVKPADVRSDVTISVLHHPYRWISQNSYREFRALIENSSHIVMTGHEHQPGRRFEQPAKGERNQYIEGLALQESANPALSSFNALVIDTARKQQRFFSFSWAGEMYAPDVDGELQESAWEDFQITRLRARDEFAISDEMLSFLDESGAPIRHPDRGLLKLKDFFIPPDVREVRRNPREPQTLLRGEKLFADVIDMPRLLITGPEQSGKTTLAKQLFLHFHGEGLVPLLIDGGSFAAKGSQRIVQDLHKLFSEQYSVDRLEHFRQLDRGRRVLIIDDFDRLRPSSKSGLIDLLNLLSDFAGRMVLVADDLAQQLGELVDARRIVNGQGAFKHYRIQVLGHAKRDELVDKWYTLSPRMASEDTEFASEVLAAKRTLEVMVGKNFVPGYPIFVLSILQARASTEPLNLNASTYGYFFELLIKNSLVVGSTRATYDIKSAYLANLAHELFQRSQADISEDNFREIHEQFVTRKALKLSFSSMKQDMLNGGILTQLGDSYWFKYKFVYYYFVATHLRDTIATSATKKLIVELSERLPDEDCANILLFLAHLSKDPFIIEQMLQRATEVFSEYTPARLRDDVAFASASDASALTNVVYVDKDVRESRREMLERLDEAEEKEGEATNRAPVGSEDLRAEWELQQSWLTRLSRAFKTLQILGQLVKNFPGHLDADEKHAITKECYLLGLRTLAAVNSLLRENREGVVRYLVDMIRSERASYRADALDYKATKGLVEKATDVIFAMTLGATYGTIQRIAYAVGSPELSLTYASVLAESDNEAFALVDVALRLDQFSAFPTQRVESLGRELEGAPVASSVLRNLVVNHFYLFPVDLAIRQRVCASLNIPIQRTLQRGPNIKLVGPGKSKSEGDE